MQKTTNRAKGILTAIKFRFWMDKAKRIGESEAFVDEFRNWPTIAPTTIGAAHFGSPIEVRWGIEVTGQYDWLGFSYSE